MTLLYLCWFMCLSIRPAEKWYLSEMGRVNQLAGSGEHINFSVSQPKAGLLSKIFVGLVNWRLPNALVIHNAVEVV